MADFYGAQRHRASALSAFFVEGSIIAKASLNCTLLYFVMLQMRPGALFPHPLPMPAYALPFIGGCAN
jgi:hypothetical protein